MSFDTIAGLILMCVLGPAVGNYACSVVYRLPRGQTPFEKRPYCGHCGAMLKPIDLFPIISYLLTRGKCRYCSDPIRGSYFVIEVLCLLVFVGNYLSFGLSESFILLSSYAVFLIILSFIDYHEGFLSNFMLTLAFGTIGVFRVLHEGTIYPWIQGGFVGLFIAALVWQASRQGKGTLLEVPHWVWLCGLIFASLPIEYAFIAVGLAAFFYCLQRIASRWRSPTAAICLSLYCVLAALSLTTAKGVIPL